MPDNPKPNIANPVIEFDSREVSGVPIADWGTVTTWPDTSGNNNDGTGGSGTRYEERGFGGTEPNIRFEDIPDDHFHIPVVTLAGNGFTLFAVFEPVVLTTAIGIIGSDGGSSPGPRNVELFVRTDGTLVFSRTADPLDLVSAPGVIVAGTKYVVTARYSSVTGMIIRVNGVQVGSVADAAALATQITWVIPSVGLNDDQSVGGIGRVAGEKRFVWAAGYNTPASDGQITDMEGFLGDLFTVPGVTLPVKAKPTITNPEFEYDIASYSSQTEGDQVGPWTDTSGQGNNATVGQGSPEYAAGAWLPTGNTTDVRLDSGGIISYNGAGFVATDLTVFWVFRTFDLSSTLALMGGSSFADFFMLEMFVRTNGAIVFSFGTNEGASLAVETAAGVIVADGTCYVVTFKHTNAGGKIIRVDGVQIAANASATGNLQGYSAPRIGNIANLTLSNYEKHAWISGHAVGASDADMALMEAFLDETFCTLPLPPAGGPWFPSGNQLPVDTTWAPSV